MDGLTKATVGAALVAALAIGGAGITVEHAVARNALTPSALTVPRCAVACTRSDSGSG